MELAYALIAVIATLGACKLCDIFEIYFDEKPVVQIAVGTVIVSAILFGFIITLKVTFLYIAIMLIITGILKLVGCDIL